MEVIERNRSDVWGGIVDVTIGNITEAPVCPSIGFVRLAHCDMGASEVDDSTREVILERAMVLSRVLKVLEQYLTNCVKKLA